MTFAQYVEGTLRDQLTIAPGLSPDSPLQLTAHLDSVSLDAWRPGHWRFVVTFRASGGEPFTIRAHHPFETAFGADGACRIVAQQLAGAAMELLAQLVAHPHFQQLLRSGPPPGSAPDP
jgi:hypothetical protein